MGLLLAIIVALVTKGGIDNTGGFTSTQTTINSSRGAIDNTGGFTTNQTTINTARIAIDNTGG